MDCRREHDRLTRLAEKRAKRRTARQMVDSLWDTPVTGRAADWDSMMGFKEDQKMSDKTKWVLWHVAAFFAGGLVVALFKLLGG